MLNRIRNAIKSDIIKVSSLTAISTFVKMISGLVSVKVVAIIIGPNGLALLGQLNNFSSIAMTFASGGINNGVTKYIAEYKDSEEKISYILGTAFRITLILSIICSLGLIIFSEYWAELILKNKSFSLIFILFGITIIFFALNSLLISIINGFKDFKNYVVINIIASIVSLIFSVSLTLIWGVTGALISAVTSQSIIFVVTFFLVLKISWFNKENFWGSWHKPTIIKLFQYSLMMLVSSVTSPITQLWIRSYLGNSTSWGEAGLWEGINRISNMYLLFITSTLSVYYLPRLAEIIGNKELKKEILKTYKLVIPILIFISFMIFILRDFIIQLLFTNEFYMMRSLFIFQMLGDIFKIAAWLLAFQMVAKAMTLTYIITEIVFAISLVLFSIIFINLFGFIGPTIAYMVNYFILFLAMLLIFRKLLFYNELEKT